MQNNIINPAEVKAQLEALANDIESSDKKAANRLHNLRVAVSGGNNADAWASADIVRLINPEQIVENYKNQPLTDRVISALEWARNILIFLPLLVSWFGISQAVSKYSDFVGKHQDQITQPFLYLWQTGFGGELPIVFTLGFLAGIDAFLLLLLVTATIVHTSLTEIGKQRRLKDAERLRADLSDALAGAALCLTTRNWQQPKNFVDSFDQSSRFFKEAIEKLLARIETLAQTQKQDHQIFADLRKDLTGIMSTVSSSVTDLKTSTDALRQSMGNLVAPTQKISTNLEIVGATSQELVVLYKSQINGLQTILNTLQQWGTNLQNTLGKLDTAVNAGQTLANNIDKFTKRDEVLFAALTKELSTQSDLTRSMTASNADTRQFVSDLARCLNEYRALNIQVDEFTRRVAILTQKIPTH